MTFRNGFTVTKGNSRETLQIANSANATTMARVKLINVFLPETFFPSWSHIHKLRVLDPEAYNEFLICRWQLILGYKNLFDVIDEIHRQKEVLMEHYTMLEELNTWCVILELDMEVIELLEMFPIYRDFNGFQLG